MNSHKMNSNHKAASCYHCGLPVPTGSDIHVHIRGAAQVMCCHGCEAVAQAIVDQGLLAFYDKRSAMPDGSPELIPDDLQQQHVYDHQSVQAQFVEDYVVSGAHAGSEGQHSLPEAESLKRTQLIIEGIVCAACVWLNENHVRSVDGVISFNINYSTHRAELIWDNEQVKLSEVLHSISLIGYHAHPYDSARSEQINKKENTRALFRIAIAAVGMMQVMMTSLVLYLYADELSGLSESVMRYTSFAFATPVFALASSHFISNAWRDLKRRRLGMDAPVALALIISFSASVWAVFTGTGEVYFDSVTMFSFFLLLGRYLEMRARHHAAQSQEALLKSQPIRARLLADDSWVPVTALNVGDAVLVKAGETLPCDGVLLSDSASVDEAILTGESRAKLKHKGERVLAGCINQQSAIEVKVSEANNGTVLASMLNMIEQAQRHKSPLAALADRIAKYFVAAQISITALVYVAWMGNDEAFSVALSVLVVSCPCALSLATPVALTAGVNGLLKRKILLRDGAAVSQLSRIKTMVFDKTGTLTEGKFTVAGHVFNADQTSIAGDQLMQALEVIESRSEHPLANALISYAVQQVINSDSAAMSGRLCNENSAIEHSSTEQSTAWQMMADSVTIQAGLGVSATLQRTEAKADTDTDTDTDTSSSLNVGVGSMTWMAGAGVDISLAQQGMRRYPSSTVVCMADLDRRILLAAFYMRDEVRTDAISVIKSLKHLGIECQILSGDNSSVVADVAQQLGITQWQAEALPDEKLAHVNALIAEDKSVVCMVGDGINDAPVLAGADVSIAVASASALSKASADVILLDQALSQVSYLTQQARRIDGIIKQNYAWAIGYNAVMVPVASLGLISPWMSALGMSASSLVVVLNALRLR